MNNPDIKKYLKQIKNKLPEWLKDKKKEVQDILDEIENHIYEKAVDISGSEYPREESIQEAIKLMGNPEDIARDYKRRGSPKYYITEELMPFYQKTLLIIIAITSAIAIFANIPWGGTDNIWETFASIWNSLVYTIAIITILVSIIFVYLSVEGYLPEDLGIKPKDFKPLKKSLNKSKARKFYRPGEWIIGAIFGLTFGIIIVLQPFSNITKYLEPEFINWLRIWGIIIFVEGFLNLSHILLQKSNLTGHRIIKFLKIITSILTITIFLWLKGHPEIISIISVVNGVVSVQPISELGLNIDQIFTWLIIIIVFSTTIGIIEEFARSLTMKDNIDYEISQENKIQQNDENN